MVQTLSVFLQNLPCLGNLLFSPSSPTNTFLSAIRSITTSTSKLLISVPVGTGALASRRSGAVTPTRSSGPKIASVTTSIQEDRARRGSWSRPRAVVRRLRASVTTRMTWSIISTLDTVAFSTSRKDRVGKSATCSCQTRAAAVTMDYLTSTGTRRSVSNSVSQPLTLNCNNNFNHISGYDRRILWEHFVFQRGNISLGVMFQRFINHTLRYRFITHVVVNNTKRCSAFVDCIVCYN